MALYHYLYKTTNLVNGKIYVGIHSCELPFGSDNYIGSGVALLEDIRKYGHGSFKCERVCEEPTRQLVLELERLVVDEDFVKREDTYNLTKGGGGNGGYIWTDSQRNATSKRMKGNANCLNKEGKPWNLGKKTPDHIKKKAVESRRKFDYQTPKGIFKNPREAAKANKMSLRTITRRFSDESNLKFIKLLKVVGG